MESDGLILVNIENVEELLHILLLGGDYLAGECVPDNRDLLEKFHEIFEFHISLVLREDSPAKPGLVDIIALENNTQIVQVILFSYFSVSVLVDEVEDPADEGVLPAQQPQSSAELLVGHVAGVAAELVEPFGDGIEFFDGEVELLVGGVGVGVFGVDELSELLVDDFGLLELYFAAGWVILLLHIFSYINL